MIAPARDDMSRQIRSPQPATNRMPSRVSRRNVLRLAAAAAMSLAATGCSLAIPSPAVRKTAV